MTSWGGPCTLAELEATLEKRFANGPVVLLRYDGMLLLRCADEDAFFFRYHVRDWARREGVPLSNLFNGWGERRIRAWELLVTDAWKLAEWAYLRACRRYRVEP